MLGRINLYRMNKPSYPDRIDACSALDPIDREHAALALYTELVDHVDAAAVDAVTWRAMAIELGVCAMARSGDRHEFIRARSADAHQRADFIGRLAARTLQSISSLRNVPDFVSDDGSVRLTQGALS